MDSGNILKGPFLRLFFKLTTMYFVILTVIFMITLSAGYFHNKPLLIVSVCMGLLITITYIILYLLLHKYGKTTTAQA